MGILDKILDKMFETRSKSWLHADHWYNNSIIFGNKSTSGIKVNEELALQYSVVYGCIKLLSDTVGSLPLHLYRKLPDDNRERATKGEKENLYRIFNNSPNEEMSAFRIKSVIMAHLAGYGNSYSNIERDAIGRAIALWPLLPNEMKVERNNTNEIIIVSGIGDILPGEIYYEHTRVTRKLLRKEIFHIPGFGYNGLVGLSPITLAREGIGLGIAYERYGGNFFGHGTTPGLVLQHPNKLSSEAHDRLKKSIDENNAGLDNSFKRMILEEGMELKNPTISPEDSQYIEGRQFQINDICRWWRIPPHMIQDLTRSTFTNIEHQSIDFVVHTMRPWLTLIEQELNRYFLTPTERQKYYFEFLVDSLLRGDIESRFNAYNTARNMGTMSANDIRKKENQEPIGKEGDIYVVPMNMTNMEFLLEQPEPIEKAPEGPLEPAEEDGELEGEGDKKKEERALPAAKDPKNPAERNRLTKSFHNLFKNSAQKVVNKETIAIRKQVKKSQNSKVLKLFIEDFYTILDNDLQRNLFPTVSTYIDQIQSAASKEIGAEVDMTSEIEKFSRDYMDILNREYRDTSKFQLLNLIDETEQDKMQEVIEERLDSWREKKADKLAEKETVSLASATAIKVFAIAGITKLIWRNQGSDTCDFCKSLNGKVVGIGQPFTNDLEVKGQKLKTYGPKFFPQLHRGCSCIIVPGG